MGQSHNQSHNITMKETVIKYIKTNRNIDVNTSKKIADFVNKNPQLISHTVHKIQNISKGKYNTDEASKALAGMLVMNKVFDKKTFNLVIPLNLKPDRISKTLEFITGTSAIGTTITERVTTAAPNDNKHLGSAFERETKEKIEESPGKITNAVFKGAETTRAVNEIRKGINQRITLNKINKKNIDEKKIKHVTKPNVSVQRQILSSDISNEHTVLKTLSLKTYKQQITSLLREHNKISGKISAYQGTGTEAPIALQKALKSKKQEILDLYQKVSGHPAKDFNSAVKELTIGSGITKHDLQKAFNNGLQQEKQQIMQKTIAVRKSLTSTGNTGTEISKNAIDESKKVKSGILKGINTDNKKPTGLLQNEISKKALLANLSTSVVSNVTDTVKKSIKQRNDKGSTFTHETSEQMSNVVDAPNKIIKAYHEARVASRFSTRIAERSVTIIKKVMLTFKAIVHGLGTTITTLFSGPTIAAVLIALLFVVIVMSMFPGLLYSTLTIPSSDISINETIGYFSYLRANTVSILKEKFLFNNNVTFPEDEVSDEYLWGYVYKNDNIDIKEEKMSGKGYLFVLSPENGIDKDYFNPMSYIAGTSTLYSVYGFPYLQIKIKDKEYYVPTGPISGAPSPTLDASEWIAQLPYIYMIHYVPYKGQECYYDATGKESTSNDWNNKALRKYEVSEKKAFQHTWAYTDWWWKAKELKMRLDLFNEMKHEANIEEGAGFLNNKEVFKKIEQQKKEEKWEEDYEKLTKSEESKELLKESYLGKAQQYNTDIKETINKLNDIKAAINSLDHTLSDAWSHSKYGKKCGCGLRRGECKKKDEDGHCIEWTTEIGDMTDCSVCTHCRCIKISSYKYSDLHKYIVDESDRIDKYIDKIKNTTKIDDESSNMSDLLMKEYNTYFTTLTPDGIQGDPRDNWFSNETLQDTDKIILQELVQLKADENSIHYAVSNIETQLGYIQSWVNALQGWEEIKCDNCYDSDGKHCSNTPGSCGGTKERVENDKESANATIDSIRAKLFSIAKDSQDMANIAGQITYFLNCKITSGSSEMLSINDHTFDGVSGSQETLDALKNSYQNKPMAIYILNKLQELKNSDNEEISKKAKESIEQFINLYNPLGMVFKQILDGKTIDEYQSNNEKLVVYRDFGYYYNPFAFVSTESLNTPGRADTPINPVWQPEEFTNCHLPKLEQLFTTAYYGGEVNQQGVKKGNLNRSQNWHNNIVMFRGCIIGTEKGLDGPAFKVYAPVGGEASIEKDESGNEFLVIYHKGSSELVNINEDNNTRVLTDKLVLGGITLDSNIQNKINNEEEIGNGEYLGTAKMLYISYAQEDDLWYKWLFVFMKPKYIIYYIDPIYYMYCETGLPKFAP